MGDAPRVRDRARTCRVTTTLLVGLVVGLVGGRALPAGAVCGDQIIDPGEQCETGPYGDAACVRACVVPGQPDECTCAVPPLTTAGFSLIAQNTIKLCANSKVLSGHVAVVHAGGTLTLGESSKVSTDGAVIGDIVQMHGGSSVGRVFANSQFFKSGALVGDGPYRFRVPLGITVPQVRSADPGTDPGTPRKAQAGEVVILPPGTYGTITIFRGGTLRLRGTDPTTGTGVYNLTSLTVQPEASVVVDNPVDVRIADRLLVATRAFVGPADGVHVLAGDVDLSVNGSLVRIGHLARIRAHLRSAGTIRLGKESSVEGQVYALNVKLGAIAQVSAEGGCGDGMLDAGEQCDASAPGGTTCPQSTTCVAADHPGQCTCH
jgi:hypothetical protein